MFHVAWNETCFDFGMKCHFFPAINTTEKSSITGRGGFCQIKLPGKARQGVCVKIGTARPNMEPQLYQATLTLGWYLLLNPTMILFEDGGILHQGVFLRQRTAVSFIDPAIDRVLDRGL